MHTNLPLPKWLTIVVIASTLYLATACSQQNGNAKTADSSASKADKTVSVLFKTSMGDFTIRVNAEKAPITAENFLQYVNDGYYNGTIFHRVIDNFMVQGGGLTQDFNQKTPRDPIQNEANNGLLNTTGSVAMARTGIPHSATSQFFINVRDNEFLNHKNETPAGWGYAVFGEVSDGMATINAIKQVATGSTNGHQNAPLSPIVIDSATVIAPES
jgi:peptidyl-prolyl cis-trans isomerase B (cyclophilin B)